MSEMSAGGSQDSFQASLPNLKGSVGLGEETCGCLMGGGGSGRDLELGLIRHNLEQIYKEILLNSIENFV